MVTRMIKRFLLPTSLAVLVMLPSLGNAEMASIYGVELPAAQGGGFRPAGTNLTCYGFDKDSRCWDGRAWHEVYPTGSHHYARAQGQVDCVVITKETGDCWDGHAWYKLPVGTAYGVVLPAPQGGAFRTFPLPPEAER
jgi:hypothetical protein